MRPCAPSPARSSSVKFLVRREPIAPKIQSDFHRAPRGRAHAKSFHTFLPHDCNSTNFRLAPCMTMISTMPACMAALIQRAKQIRERTLHSRLHPPTLANVRHVQGSRRDPIKCCEVAGQPARSFGTYSTIPFCANAPVNAANLPSSIFTTCPRIFASTSGCFSCAVFKSVKMTPFLASASSRSIVEPPGNRTI